MSNSFLKLPIFLIILPVSCIVRAGTLLRPAILTHMRATLFAAVCPYYWYRVSIFLILHVLIFALIRLMYCRVLSAPGLRRRPRIS